MTKAKPLPEIARCACGLRVDSIKSEGHRHRVWCFCGWKGPWRATVRGAILAWNRVMAVPEHWSTVVRRLFCHRLMRANMSGGTDMMFAEIDKIRRGE